MSNITIFITLEFTKSEIYEDMDIPTVCLIIVYTHFSVFKYSRPVNLCLVVYASCQAIRLSNPENCPNVQFIEKIVTAVHRLANQIAERWKFPTVLTS